MRFQISIPAVFGVLLGSAVFASGPGPAQCPRVYRQLLTQVRQQKAQLEAFIPKHLSAGQAMFEGNTLENGGMKAGGGVNNLEYPDVWTRDEAIAQRRRVRTMDQLFNKFPTGSNPAMDARKEHGLIEELHYLAFTEKVQRTPTAVVEYGSTDFVRDEHGNIRTALNPAEPKFSANGEALLIPWGRPQNDSPALRGISHTELAYFLHKHQNDPMIQRMLPDLKQIMKRLYDGRPPWETTSVVKTDMEYVFHHTAIDKDPVTGKWKGLSFEYWEEVLARAHFSTMLVHRQSLIESGMLARITGDKGAALEYYKKAKKLEPEIRKLWDPRRRYLTAHMDRVGEAGASKVSNADTQVLIAITQTQGPGAMYRYTDDQVISTIHEYEQIFARAFEVNRNPAFRAKYPRSQAMGRYPEDFYAGRSPTLPEAKGDTGNPWVIVQNTWADLHYGMAEAFVKNGKISLNDLNLPFFRNVLLNPNKAAKLRAGMSVSKGDPLFNALVDGLMEKGDESLSIIREVTANGGNFNEQFNRAAYPLVPDARSSEGLSWNAITFENAVERRDAARGAIARSRR